LLIFFSLWKNLSINSNKSKFLIHFSKRVIPYVSDVFIDDFDFGYFIDYFSDIFDSISTESNDDKGVSSFPLMPLMDSED